MKIAYVFSDFPIPTQTFAQSDIKELQRQGHDVTIFCLKAGKKSLVDPAFKVDKDTSYASSILPIFLHPLVALKMLLVILRNFFSYPVDALTSIAMIGRAIKIAEACRDHDVVHAFWGRHPSLVLVALKHLGRKPLRSIFVGAYDLVNPSFIVPLGISVSDVRFTHADVNVDFFRNMGCDVNVVRRGIPLDSLIDEPPTERTIDVITASALVKSKRVDRVIDIVNIVRRRGHPVNLTIAGDGPEMNNLTGQFGDAKEDYVAFTGHIDRGNLFSLMQRSKVFLFLSEKPSERLPNVLKEAIYAGCRVISLSSPGLDELICDETIGKVVLPGVSDESIATLLIDEQRKFKFNDHVDIQKCWIRDNFSTQSSMNSYCRIWGEASH